MSGLSVEDLRVEYRLDVRGQAAYAAALKGVSIHVEPGRSLGILGETGSGKSSLGMAIMRLLPVTARVTGSIRLNDYDLLNLDRKQLEKIRGSEIGMIFQDPGTALNPVRTIGAQISETARVHNHSLSRSAARQLAIEAVEELGLKGERLTSYPHQLSGGMQQRALIASVMVANPKFLIADEPTASLDKVTEHQIILLLRRLQRERQLGFILISHHIGVVGALCDDVAVIYKGQVVESGPTKQVLRDPQHPYTNVLVNATRRTMDDKGRLVTAPPVRK
jgi:ABC-type dipeptide/oligopeptide/nickel transport system ATPase component